MASKGKEKLTKKQFKVGGKIIDLERFAYDMLVHSAKTFGVEEQSIGRWKGVENDYGLTDFIVCMSRFSFRCQITKRSFWYPDFKYYYDYTKFQSFDKIKPALQRILYEKGRIADSRIIHEAIISLSVMSELMLFLYTNNCAMYPVDLAKYWVGCWSCKKKDLEKAGGFEYLYDRFYIPGDNSADVFFNQFIIDHCIPYQESPTLEGVFMEEYKKFFNLTAKTLAEREKPYLERTPVGASIGPVPLPSSLDCETSEENAASGTSIPRNTGLGIQTHEDLLKNVIGSNTVTSPENIPSTGRQGTERDRRESTNQKEGRKKKSSSSSSEGDLEASGNDVLRNTGLGIPTHEDLVRDVYAADAVTSSQDLPSTSREKTVRDRRASSQKVGQKKKSTSRSIVEDLEQLNLDAPKKPSGEKKK